MEKYNPGSRDNIFIVFEGIDGIGKGTQLRNLFGYYYDGSKRNIVHTVREPTYGEYGMQIRELLKPGNDPYSDPDKLLKLFSMDRERDLKKYVEPNYFLEKDGLIRNIVIMDRYMYSTYAYQMAQGIPFEKIDEYQKDFLKPDVCLIFTVDSIEAVVERMKKDNRVPEKFEAPPFLNKVNNNYKNIIKELNSRGHRIFEINADPDISLELEELKSAKMEKKEATYNDLMKKLTSYDKRLFGLSSAREVSEEMKIEATEISKKKVFNELIKRIELCGLRP